MAKIVVAQEAIYRRNPKNMEGNPDWGNYQVRMKNTFALSPKLLKYRQCVAGELKGKQFNNLAEVQTAFALAAAKCKAQVANMPHYGKVGRSKVVVFSKGAYQKLEGKAEKRIEQSEQERMQGKTPRILRVEEKQLKSAASQLGISESDLNTIKSEYAQKASQQKSNKE